MPKAICPDCDEAGREVFLREVVTTGIRKNPDKGTDCWWVIELHSDGQGGLCPGGGKRV